MSTSYQLPDGVPPLSTYYFYLAGACNLACRHCWITPSFVHPGDDASAKCLPFEMYEQAIREAEPLGLTHLKLTGGEPFVHPDIARMLSYAAQRQLGVTIETNGTLITADLARFLHDKTTTSFISVSLDGATASTHEYMRGVAGSFARAQAGIRYLVAAGFGPQVIISLHEDNLDEIEPLAQWAVSAGCSSVKLNIIQETGRGTHFGKRLREIGQLIELGRWIETELQSRINIPLYYSWPPAFKRIRQLAAEGGCASCNIFNILGVLHTGEFSLCGIGVQDKNLVYGEIGKDPLVDLWVTHPFIQQMRQTVPSKLRGICGNCLLRDVCLGYCVANTYHRTGDPLSPFWFCEQADEAGLFPAHRKRDVCMSGNNVGLLSPMI